MATKNQTNSESTASANAESRPRSAGRSVNRVTVVGRFVADAELRTTGTGKHVTTVRVATNDRNQVEFHDVVLWGQLADFATSYLGKGRLVYIEGRLQARTWQAGDGSTRRTVEIVADKLQALSSKGSTPAGE